MVLGESTLVDLLESVSSQEDLWAAVGNRITRQHYRFGRSRFAREEIDAFIDGGRRAGLEPEQLALEYWKRANKDSVYSAFGLAEESLGSRYVDAHSGYDLKNAIYDHLGWMREAEVPIPAAVMDELLPYAKVLAAHLRANRFYPHELMPVVRMFADRLPDFDELEVIAAKSLIKNKVNSPLLFRTREEAEDLARSMNILESHSALGEDYYNVFLHKIERAFEWQWGLMEYYTTFFKVWNWSAHSDDVYSMLFAAALDSRRNPDSLGMKVNMMSWHDILSETAKPSPALSRLLEMSAEELHEISAQKLYHELGSASDSSVKEALESILEREFSHPGFMNVPLRPSQIGFMASLYAGLGDPSQSLMGNVEDYAVTALSGMDFIGAGSLVSHFPEERQRAICQSAISGLTEAAGRAYRHNSPSRDSITSAKDRLSGYSRRIVAIAKIANDRAAAHANIEQITREIPSTRFGIGLHYLSSLVIDYFNAFGESPLYVILGASLPDQIKDYFAAEKSFNRRARIYPDERAEIDALYERAFKILFGMPIPERPRAPERPRTATKQIEAKKESPMVIAYIGSRSYDGSDRETVELLLKNLESRLSGITLEEGTVPGKGRVYGIGMTPDAFAKAAEEGILPGIQAVYVSRLPKIDDRKFKATRHEAGYILQTAPTPNTFAIHHLNSLAAALSGSAPAQPKKPSQSYTKR